MSFFSLKLNGITGAEAVTCQIVIIQELYSIRLTEPWDSHFHARRVGCPASSTVVHDPTTQENTCELQTAGVHLLTVTTLRKLQKQKVN